MRDWMNLVESLDFDIHEGGWITDDGEILNCDKAMDRHHSDIAREYLEDEPDYDEDGFEADIYGEDAASEYMQQALEAGWVRFGSIGLECYVECYNINTKAKLKLLSIAKYFGEDFKTYTLNQLGSHQQFSDLRSFRIALAKI
jgi:hypothetical protein